MAFSVVIVPFAALKLTVSETFQEPADVWIDPLESTVPICTLFTVNVMVAGVTDLASYELSLSYDTAYVDCVDIKDGCFLASPKHETGKAINETAGLIYYGYQSDAGGIDGDGILATITFHCTAPGESIINIDSAQLWDPTGLTIPIDILPIGCRITQFTEWEPAQLIDIVEWSIRSPYDYALVGLPTAPEPYNPKGRGMILAELESKGYEFDFDVDSFFNITICGKPSAPEPYNPKGSANAIVESWWSSNTLEDGTRACLLSAEVTDASGETTSISMGFVTNLLPPELVPGVDPYIIVNAQPYIFVRFYWYEWPTYLSPLGKIITWSYWWYDSHSHPNWFWGPYWWWRVYTKAYFLGMPWPPVDVNWGYWQPWWGWWWHWVYWKHWYWWSTYFPYSYP